MRKVQQCSVCGATYNPDEVSCCPICGGTQRTKRPRGDRGKTIKGKPKEIDIRCLLDKKYSIQRIMRKLEVSESTVYNVRANVQWEEKQAILGQVAMDQILGWAVNPITYNLVEGSGQATEDGSEPLDDFDGAIVDGLFASLEPHNPPVKAKIHELIFRLKVMDRKAPDQIAFYSLGSNPERYKFRERHEMTIGGVKIKGWYVVENFRPNLSAASLVIQAIDRLTS